MEMVKCPGNARELIIGLATFLLAFLLSILLTRAIDKSDIDNLREMTSELGSVNKVLRPILNMTEKLLARR